MLRGLQDLVEDVVPDLGSAPALDRPRRPDSRKTRPKIIEFDLEVAAILAPRRIPD